MQIVRCSRENAQEWADLRAQLWPQMSGEENAADIERMLAQTSKFAGWLAFRGAAPAGFAEASLRFDYVNGCETSPVAFLEGIFVRTEHRRKGVARSLCAALEAWAREKACTEMGSDALLDNLDSHRMHDALGFQETERVVYFRKRLV